MTVITHERFQGAFEPQYGTEAAVAPAGAASITLTGLEKSFSGNRVLRGINLHIPAGQFIAVTVQSPTSLTDPLGGLTFDDYKNQNRPRNITVLGNDYVVLEGIKDGDAKSDAKS